MSSHDDRESDKKTSDSGPNPSRRNLLRAGGAALVTFTAGCNSGGDGGDGDGGGDGGGGDGGGGDGGGDGGGGDGGDGMGPVVPEIIVDVGQLGSYPDQFRNMLNVWEQELGLKTKMNVRDFSAHQDKVNVNSEFDHIAYHGKIATPARIDPDNYLRMFYSEGGVTHNNHWENEEYDQLYEQQRQTYDEEERKELISQMHQMLYDNYPEFVYLWPDQVYAYNAGEWDITPTPFLSLNLVASMSFINASATSSNREFIVGAIEDMPTQNPFATPSNGVHYFWKLVFDTPRRFDTEGNFVDWATTVDVQDNTTVDLQLKRGMSFHDGEDVTADDLAFSFNFFKETGFPLFGTYTSTYTEASVQDDRTVRVSLENPDVTFLTNTLNWMPIVPEHVWGQFQDEDNPSQLDMSADQIVGSGPFQLAEWGNRLTRLETFDGHFQTPDYDALVYQKASSIENLRARLAQQEIDSTAEAPPTTVTTQLAENNQHIELAKEASLTHKTYMYNNSNPPFDDAAMRRAVARAVDVEIVAESFYNDEVTYGDGTVINPGLKWNTHDFPPINEANGVDAAKSILEDAGYAWDDQGRLHYPPDS